MSWESTKTIQIVGDNRRHCGAENTIGSCHILRRMPYYTAPVDSLKDWTEIKPWAEGAKVFVQIDGSWDLELQIPRHPQESEDALQIVNSRPEWNDTVHHI